MYASDDSMPGFTLFSEYFYAA